MSFIVWIAFIFLQQKTNVNLIKKSCENKDFKLRIKVSMLSEDTEILAFNQYQNCHLLEKIDGFKNKPEN